MKVRDVTPFDELIETGRYEFTAERIIAFARKFDPQYFHLDAEKAKASVLGGLCASGWHVSAAMMKCNTEAITRQAHELIARGETPPKFGPSPGFRNMKWIKPVYAGDTITYFMRLTRPRADAAGPQYSRTEL